MNNKIFEWAGVITAILYSLFVAMNIGIESRPAEIGMMDINFTQEKNKDNLFSKFPDQIKSLQWHSYEVQEIENNNVVTLLASSPITKYQIFKYVYY